MHHLGKLYEGQHCAIIDEQLWQLVQQQLANNRNKKSLRTEAKAPSLLAGLIFDDKNNVMSPTHTIRKNQRFQYYISQAVLQFREHKAGTVTRIPAHAVEDVVSKELVRILKEPNYLLTVAAVNHMLAHHQQLLIAQGSDLADKWRSFTPHQQIEHLNQLIQKISVGRNEIRIVFSKSAFVEILLKDIPEIKEQIPNINERYEISVPVKLKRCGLETRLIVSDDDTSKAHPKTVQAIQNALSKALLWNQALVSGTTSSMTALAKQENVTQRYIAHLIKLAFLAPDIIEAIKHGDIPATLSLDRLKKGFSFDWDEQRKLFGYTVK